MATTLKIAESPPLEYPAITGLTSATAIAAVWQRIETWINWRWGERECVFTVEGPGHWTPPLQPGIITLSEIWRDADWEAVTLSPTPLGGLVLPECGHYRIEAAVGSADDPPAAVLEAARRLGQYFAVVAECELAGVEKTTIEGVGAFEMEPRPAGRAMQLSGCADLLRPWRDLGAC